MPTGGTVLEGTYMQKLLQLFPDYVAEDFWSLVFCGDDLDNPYNGWSGYAAVPLFSDRDPVELFFGDFSDSLAQYENVPSYAVCRDISKTQAFSELRSFFEAVSDHPVFISANAGSWPLPIITEAVNRCVEGPWNAQLICLRDLYSATRDEIPILGTSYVGDVFSHAAKLPKRFGLRAIAAALDVDVPNPSNQVMYRARLTAKAASSCLLKQYPLQ